MTCGTGGWSGPLPGDPDNNSILTATPAFGGIDVEWTFPEVNPHAVAHTYLYRGTSPNFEHAVRHKVVAGNFFYDRIETATAIQYYYWIQIVSINGTVGEPIGPASAIARPTIEDYIELLTNKIDSGVLAASLKATIDQIQLNKLALDNEILARAASDDALGASYNELLAYNDETRALLQEEVLARADADEAFVQSVNSLYAEYEDVMAAVQDEVEARVAGDTALATAITTAQTTLAGNISSVQTTLQTEINTVNEKVTDIGARWTAVVDVNGLVGGFGVYNDGSFVEAGFDVDTFWIGRTGSDNKKPFMVEGGEVFINDAVINKLTFNKLRAADGSLIVSGGKIQAQYLQVNEMQSNNWSPGWSGWRFSPDGTFEMNSSEPGDGYIRQNGQRIDVYDGNEVLRVRIGKLN